MAPRLTVTDILVKVCAQDSQQPEVNVAFAEAAVAPAFVRQPRGHVGVQWRWSKDWSYGGAECGPLNTGGDRSPPQRPGERARAGSWASRIWRLVRSLEHPWACSASTSFRPSSTAPERHSGCRGAWRERPVAVDAQSAVSPDVVLTLSVDHRLLDGARVRGSWSAFRAADRRTIFCCWGSPARTGSTDPVPPVRTAFHAITLSSLSWAPPGVNLTFVVLETDAGSKGVRRGTLNNRAGALLAICRGGPRYALGQTPSYPGHLRPMYRRDYGRAGEIVMSASRREMACWDIIGKALNQPVYRVMGGAVRPRVPAYAKGYTR